MTPLETLLAPIGARPDLKWCKCDTCEQIRTLLAVVKVQEDLLEAAFCEMEAEGSPAVAGLRLNLDALLEKIREG